MAEQPLALLKLKSAVPFDGSKAENDNEGFANLQKAIKGHIEEKMKAKKAQGKGEKGVSFKKVIEKAKKDKC